MKRIIAIILCAVMAFALIGCGSKASESGNSVTESSQQTESTGGSFSKGESKEEESVVEESEETSDLSVIAGEYHISKFISGGNDLTQNIMPFVENGDFDQWVVITEDGQFTLYQLDRTEDKESEPQAMGSYKVDYDSETGEIIVLDFDNSSETITCDGTTLIMESVEYHMEFTRK